jgi:hypothetical protein
MTGTAWDSSWLMSDGSLIGRLLHTLIGYTSEPSWAQLLVYVITIDVILGLMRLARLGDPCTASLKSTVFFCTKRQAGAAPSLLIDDDLVLCAISRHGTMERPRLSRYLTPRGGS